VAATASQPAASVAEIVSPHASVVETAKLIFFFFLISYIFLSIF